MSAAGPTSRFWQCPSCGKHAPARLTACRCGYSRTTGGDVALEAPRAADGVDTRDGPTWFAVGPAKLVVMCLATLGLYQVYWFYQQWRRVRDSGEDVSPLPRSIFGVLFCYPLFKRMAESADAVGASLSPGPLAVAYILLSVSWKLPMPWGLLSVLSVLPLAVAQRVASAVAERDFPRDDPNRRLTAANWLAVAASAAFVGWVGYALVQRTRPLTLQELSQIADDVNRKPRTPSSDGIVLDRVAAEPGALVYSFTVTEETKPKLLERRPLLKELMAGRLCREPLLARGVTMRFLYRDAAGGEVAAVDVAPADCPRR
jgi:hypothetical protein